MRGEWLFELALRLVPGAWRGSVRADLQDEARASGRGDVWCAWHVLRAALRMRVTFSGDAMIIDARYAIRSLLHAKGFTFAAVLTLVLGIGVNVAVFTVVDRVLFRPLPFADADRLVMVTPFDAETGARYISFRKHLFVEARRSLPGIDDMAFAGFTYGHAIGADETTPATLGLAEASVNLIDVLGVVPVLGRGFRQDDVDAKRAVAVITAEAWQAQFAGATDVIGRRVRMGEASREIVGVLPEGFIVPALERSFRFDGLYLVAESLETYGPHDGVTPAVARLMPGVSVDVAQQQFDAIATELDPVLRAPNETRGPRVLAEPLRAGMFPRTFQYFWLVALAASLVGLLACANLSSLLLARGRSRVRDLALRASLGASRGRLLATELAQSLMLCAVAAAVSLLVLYWTAASLRALVPSSLRPFVLGELDGRVLVFSIAAAVLAALIAGALPAWRASRANLLTVLQSAAGAAGQVRAGRSGRLLLAFEAAVGVVLVAGAAVVLRSFIGMATADIGFNPAGVQVLHVGPPGVRRGGDDRAELARFRGMLDLIRRERGVIAAGFVDSMPSGGSAPATGARDWNGLQMPIGLWQMTDGFFGAIGAQIIAGQDVSRDDVDQQRPVAVVNAAAARRLWPDTPFEAIIGRALSATGQPTRRVIGVVSDIRDRPDRAADPRIFAAILPDGFWSVAYAVRTTEAGLDVESLRRTLAESHRATSVTTRPAGAMRTQALQQPRMQSIIFGSFALVGLVLAALGLFAVASFEVALRRYELGVRVALGASASQIRRLMVGESLKPVAIGIVFGLVTAYWAAEFAQSLVHQIDARDPWTLALVAAVLAITAMLAAWIPARRAARVDPVVTLRAQ